uniref:Uncharacterized protein n=1 Tax=Steinernema glaseri TaxID=37863 RepID=A0A1I7YQF2_9BILA
MRSRSDIFQSPAYDPTAQILHKKLPSRRMEEITIEIGENLPTELSAPILSTATDLSVHFLIFKSIHPPRDQLRDVLSLRNCYESEFLSQPHPVLCRKS